MGLTLVGNAAMIRSMRLAVAAAVVLAVSASPARPAGNVGTVVDQGRVLLEGDEAPNGIVVTAGDQEDGIRVFGLDGTTVNDQPEITLAGVQRLVIRTGDGPDRVELRQVRIRGSVTIRTGRGGDQVLVEQATLQRLDVRSGAGNDALSIGPQSRIRRLLHLRTGRDRDDVVIESSDLAAILASTGQGDDVLTIFDVTTTRRTQVFTNVGQDTVFFGVTRFIGDVDVNLGEDDDLLRLDTVVFEDDSDLDGGSDEDALLLDGPVDFDESPRVDFEFGG